MFFIKLLIIATIVQLLQAQESSPEYVSIVAGESPLTFIHPELPAGINDIIVWSFITGGNHSVIQSSYENPCHYLPGGFYSGFQSVPPRPGGGAENGPVQFHVTINNTDPIYYYCGQIGHCQGGMVGVINPPCTGNGIGKGSFSDYKKLAMAVTSVGPLPSVIMGGRLVPTSWPSPAPPGPPGPYYTGYSASCTVGTNSSANSTDSTTIFSTISTATSTTLSKLQPSSSSGDVSSIESSTSIPSSFAPKSSALSNTSSEMQPHPTSSAGSVHSTESKASSTTTSTAISTPVPTKTSTTIPGVQPTLSSGGRSVYGDILLKHQNLPGLVCQAGSRIWLGLIIAISFAFILL